MSKKSIQGKPCANQCGNETKKGKLCGTCTSKKSRMMDPVRYVFNNLRTNCRRRGHEFCLTLEYFRTFITGTAYMELRGRNPDDLTIDKIKNPLGYRPGNIRIITNMENVKKRWEEDYPRIQPDPVKDIEVGPNGFPLNW